MSSGFVQTQADMRERERLRGREWLRASLTGHEWLRADLTGREYRCEMAKCIFTRKNTFLGVVGV